MEQNMEQIAKNKTSDCAVFFLNLTSRAEIHHDNDKSKVFITTRYFSLKLISDTINPHSYMRLLCASDFTSSFRGFASSAASNIT